MLFFPFVFHRSVGNEGCVWLWLLVLKLWQVKTNILCVYRAVCYKTTHMWHIVHSKHRLRCLIC